MNDNENNNHEEESSQTSAMKFNIYTILQPSIDPIKLDNIILDVNHITYLAYHLVNFYVVQELPKNQCIALDISVYEQACRAVSTITIKPTAPEHERLTYSNLYFPKLWRFYGCFTWKGNGHLSSYDAFNNFI